LPPQRDALRVLVEMLLDAEILSLYFFFAVLRLRGDTAHARYEALMLSPRFDHAPPPCYAIAAAY